MKLSELSQKPKLINIVIDKKEIVKKYGEELEFHIYDRQPLDVFTKLANAKEDTAGVTELIQDMILDEQGNPVVTDGNVLPLDVIMEAVTLITKELGK
jgi:hypothetical protein